MKANSRERVLARDGRRCVNCESVEQLNVHHVVPKFDGGTVVQIDASLFRTCALLDTGAVRCWGAGGAGRLGYGNSTTISDDETPASAGDVDIADPGDVVTLGVVGLPAGAAFAPWAAASPVSVTFSWTPTASDVGVHGVSFSAQDNAGLFAPPHVINIDVEPVALPIPGISRLGMVILADLLGIAFLWRSWRPSWRPQRSVS